MRPTFDRLVGALLAALVVACAGESPVCEPGRSVSCSGSAGCAGHQVCADDGARWLACTCGDLDAGPDIDGARPSIGDDAGAPVDAGERADGAAPTDDGARPLTDAEVSHDAEAADGATDGGSGVLTDAGGPDGAADAGRVGYPPQASCGQGFAVYPDPIDVMGDGYDRDGDLITAYAWRLDARPVGSTVAFTDPETRRFSFTPDASGFYRFCVSVEARGEWSEEECCLYSSAEGFVWDLVTAPTHHLEELEVNGGSISFAFQVNQPFTPGSVSVSTSDPAWRFSTIGGSATSTLRYTRTFRLDVTMSDVALISAGDVVTASIMATPLATGSPAVMTGSITLSSAPDPGTGTPRITAFDASPFAGAEGLVRFRFDAARPAATRVHIGGYSFSPAGVNVNDDGAGDDAVAGDGWYSGRVFFPAAGMFRLQLRPTSGTALGAYYATTVTVR